MAHFTELELDSVLDELQHKKIRLLGGATSDQGWRIQINEHGEFEIFSWNEDQEGAELISESTIRSWLQRLGPRIIVKNST